MRVHLEQPRGRTTGGERKTKDDTTRLLILSGSADLLLYLFVCFDSFVIVIVDGWWFRLCIDFCNSCSIVFPCTVISFIVWLWLLGIMIFILSYLTIVLP